MNLHDWIDELCDVLDLETEVDEGLLFDLAELAHDRVDHEAGAVTAYLVGYAAALRGAGPEGVERLVALATRLAEGWDRPANAPDPDGPDAFDDEPVDDTTIDHTLDLDDDGTDDTDTDDADEPARTLDAVH